MNICYYILISTICFLMVNSYAAEINNQYALSKKIDSVVIDIQLVVENDQEETPFKQISARNLFLGHMAGAYPTGFGIDYSLQNTSKSLLVAFLGWGVTGSVLTRGNLETAIASGDIRRSYGSTGRFMAIMAGSAVGLLAGIGTSAYWRLISTVDTQGESLSPLKIN